MKVFVWKRIKKATYHHHPEGGVVVFADSLARAIELAEIAGAFFEVSEQQPDEVRECDGYKESVYIMPDAGCC